MNINRLVSLAATVAFLGCMAAAGPVSAQTKEARGTVTAVTTTTMTVKVGTQDMTFLVDSNTRLEVRRAAKEVQSQQPGNPKPRVNDFFEVGNPVLVRYKSDNAGNHALDIERVGSPGSADPTNPTKIAEGKVNAFFADNTLLEQGWIREPNKKVGDLIKEASAKVGENIQVRRFVRYQMGEE